MFAYCHKSQDAALCRCGFTCLCETCNGKETCDCSCQWLVVTGIALTALSMWISWLAWKERRRWLLTWSAVYGLMSALMTALAYALGPDPHDVFGCSVPFSLFFGSLFVTTLSCYTLDFVREGTAEGQKTERYCFDPAVGQYVLARTVNDFHVT